MKGFRQMFAVLSAGGKQYRVCVGDVIQVEKTHGSLGDVISFNNILAAGGKLGLPFIDGAEVKAELLEHRKTDKVIVFKKKRRHNYRRKHGHRQNISVLRIKEIIV